MIRKARHCECVRCGGTGYYGRVGIYEIMPVSAEIKRAINRRETADVLEDIALKQGMKTLRTECGRLCFKRNYNSGRSPPCSI